MVMEPKYYAEEVIEDPKHHLRIWRLMPRKRYQRPPKRCSRNQGQTTTEVCHPPSPAPVSVSSTHSPSQRPSEKMGRVEYTTTLWVLGGAKEGRQGWCILLYFPTKWGEFWSRPESSKSVVETRDVGNSPFFGGETGWVRGIVLLFFWPTNQRTCSLDSWNNHEQKQLEIPGIFVGFRERC